ncbi:MAG: hypothetical protein KDC27_11860 [Acidobacteria bacterium]|nr:hypothetical protein [Acidobacteriota bacterium]
MEELDINTVRDVLLPELVAEGFDVEHAVHDGETGLWVGREFFPLRLLNQNLGLLETRDFDALAAAKKGTAT